ncbi:hypothetical protein B0H34DRAFT_802895 [Crassisporium funariophilum]|nr:hypothetical protein B0H34DRAFT_803359 [Crassisporium funariophilum]KAF8148684.1 hypothetical protein B0H34DRAFT_802895 [Crassisporium funariophilum]
MDVNNILYFEDGDLEIESNDGCTFLIHKRVLRNRSLPFNELLELPDGVEEYFPLNDSAHSVQYFLMAHYNRSFFAYPPAPTTIAILLRVAQMAKKYDADDLLLIAIDHLEAHYPYTLEGWNNRGQTSALAKEPALDHVTTKLDIISTIIFIEAKWMLPAAFFSLFRHMKEEIVANDGDSNIPGCLVAWETHSRMLDDLVQTILLSIPSQRCTDHVNCLQTASTLRTNPLQLKRGSRDPILLAHKYYSSIREQVCYNCRMAFLKSMEEAMSTFWTTMPEKYGLPSWELLLQERTKRLCDD